MNGEINSTILRDKIKTRKNLRTVIDILNRNVAIITNRCEGHINIGVHILGYNTIYWRNFMLLWILYEREIYKFSSGEFIKTRSREKYVFDRISPIIKENLFAIMELADYVFEDNIDKDNFLIQMLKTNITYKNNFQIISSIINF